MDRNTYEKFLWISFASALISIAMFIFGFHVGMMFQKRSHQEIGVKNK